MNDKVISRDPGILGGTPVFSGTRIPIRILIEHLEAGDRLDDFLDSYPTVSRDRAIAVLKAAKMVLTGNMQRPVYTVYTVSEESSSQSADNDSEQSGI